MNYSNVHRLLASYVPSTNNACQGDEHKCLADVQVPTLGQPTLSGGKVGGGGMGVVTTGVLHTQSALCYLVYNPMQAPFPRKRIYMEP